MTAPEASEGARRARHFRALEGRLFEVLGQWVPSVPEPEAKLVLRRHSFQHASHADLWAGILPGSEGERPASLRPPLAAVLDAVAEPTDTIARLAGAYQVLLSHLVTAYSRLREAATAASDGPLARALELMVGDDVVACREGQCLLEGLPVSRPDAERCAAHVGRLEAMIVAAGGVDHLGEL